MDRLGLLFEEKNDDEKNLILYYERDRKERQRKE